MNAKVELYGWEVSPYTAKVDAYLHFKGIAFNKIYPNAYTLARKIQPAVGKIIMPVVYINGKNPIQDSTIIIDHFEQQNPKRPAIPTTPKQRIAAQLVELYSDEWLPMAALHYRWNYPENYNFIIDEFGSNALPYFPKFIQKKVAKTFAGKMSGYLPILGITNNTEKALEQHVETLLSLLNTHFEQHRYLLGDQPCLADFSLYGPLYAHLHRDPAPKDLVAKHSNVLAWLERIKGDTSKENNALPDNDKIPDTLIPILSHMTQSHMPLLQQTIDAIQQWAKEKHTGDKVPQRLGDATLSIEGKQEARYNLSYGYWMLQRIQETYQALTDDNKPAVDEFISQLNGFSLLKEPLHNHVTLKKCRLYLS